MQPCRQFMINDVTVCLLSTPLLLLCVIGTYETTVPRFHSRNGIALCCTVHADQSQFTFTIFVTRQLSSRRLIAKHGCLLYECRATANWNPILIFYIIRNRTQEYCNNNNIQSHCIHINDRQITILAIKSHDTQ